MLGVEYVRMDFVWWDFEPTRDAPFVFSKYDRFVEWTKANDLEIVALLNGVPSWLRPAGGDWITIPTGEDFVDFVSQFGEFVYAVVDHYKASITYFEVWNEPNIPDFWDDAEATLDYTHGGGSYARNRGIAVMKYVTLLKEAYMQAKVANPNCKIISSGLSENDYDYVQEMYGNGVKGYFDYLGLHPYFWHSPAENYDPYYVNWDDPYYVQLPKIELVRAVMLNNEDSGKYIFVTELGVGDYEGPEGPTTEEMQADRLRRAFEKIKHEYPYVKVVMWYQFRGDDHSFGLLREDYTPRQMYYAYKNIIVQF